MCQAFQMLYMYQVSDFKSWFSDYPCGNRIPGWCYGGHWEVGRVHWMGLWVSPPNVIQKKTMKIWGLFIHIGIGLLKISYILYMVQNSKSRKMYRMKNFSLSKSPSYPVHLSPKEKVKRNNRKRFHYYCYVSFQRYKWIEKQVYLLFFPFSLRTIHTALQLDFSLKNTSWRSFHITC